MRGGEDTDIQALMCLSCLHKSADCGRGGKLGMEILKAEPIHEEIGLRLASFFEQARPFLRQPTAESTLPEHVDFNRLSSFLRRVRAPLDDAEARACSNPWMAARLGHDEVRVCAVLAALWDRQQYGNEGRAFLARFLLCAGSGFPDERELCHGYRVQTEHCLNGSINDRVDITIETQSSIVGVEVKIWAAEGDRQLPRYLEAIETRARLTQRNLHKVIFLSPYEPKEANDLVSSITWQTLAALAAQASTTTQAGWLIGQFGEFCRTLGR